MVEASGFIWATIGQSTEAVPTAAAAPVAIKRKSRRVGSAEDIVVTDTIPFLSVRPARAAHRRGSLPQGATRRRRTDRPLSILRNRRPSGAISGALLAPSPGECKSARAAPEGCLQIPGGLVSEPSKGTQWWS